MSTTPIVFHYQVPFAWSHVICNCTDEETQSQIKKGLRWTRLATGQPVLPCGRLPRYLLRKCEDCGKTFVKAFTHPHECVSHAMCWDCLEQTTETQCEYYENHFHHFYCAGNPKGHNPDLKIPPDPKFLTERQPIKAEDISFETITINL